MAGLWFYGHNGKKLGPCSPQQLQDLAAAGTIQPTDTIWKEGVEQGALAKNVKHLFLIAPEPIGPGEVAAAIAPAVAANEQTPASESAVALSQDGPPASVPDSAPAGESVMFDNDDPPEPTARPKNRPDANAANKKHTQKARATALRGAVIVSQDGRNVHFRKKCPKCGLEDNCRNSLLIRSGTMRVSFFCRDCKKVRHSEILGVV